MAAAPQRRLVLPTTMDFGAYLRQAREDRGVSLREIAASTRISMTALGALERNEISKLPGGIFTRAFVRAYAGEIGLDPEETVRLFLAQFPLDSVAEGSPYVSDSKENEAFEGQRRMARTLLRLILLSVPLALIIVYFSTRGRSSAPEPASPPMRAPAASAPRARTPSPPVSSEAPPPAIETGGPTASEALTAPAASDAPVLRLDLHPQGPCWVSVHADGRPVLSRIMYAGEQEQRTAGREIMLTVGDAGAFAFTVNGQAGRPLGGRGQVATVRITRDNYAQYVAQ